MAENAFMYSVLCVCVRASAPTNCLSARAQKPARTRHNLPQHKTPKTRIQNRHPNAYTTKNPQKPRANPPKIPKMDTNQTKSHNPSPTRSKKQNNNPKQNRKTTKNPCQHACPNIQKRTQHQHKQNLLPQNENKMGISQPQQQPHNQHFTEIPTKRHNRIHRIPRNNSRHRKKTQPKLLEHNNQKIPRLPKQRKRPTHILVRDTKENSQSDVAEIRSNI